MDRFFNAIESRLENISDTMAAAVRNVEETFSGERRRRQQQQRGGDGRNTNPPPARRRRAAQPEHQQVPPGMTSTPPASSQAIRRLPTIRVAPEDLVDPCNRECCICLEKNELNDLVTRMPCAHIYHRKCLLSWLSQHGCACPVCRFELETDDAEYESGRLERMKHRKPRYALYELQRLSITELKKLSSRSVMGYEKNELIQLLVDEQRVELVPSPEPVQYYLSDLKSMSISALKRTMEDAGVFFRRQDIVEKDDMLVLFQNSGRLELLDGTEDGNMDFNMKYAHSASISVSSRDDHHDGANDPANHSPDNGMFVETVHSVMDHEEHHGDAMYVPADGNMRGGYHHNFANRDAASNDESPIQPMSIRGLMREEDRGERLPAGMPQTIDFVDINDKTMNTDDSVFADTLTVSDFDPDDITFASNMDIPTRTTTTMETFLPGEYVELPEEEEQPQQYHHHYDGYDADQDREQEHPIHTIPNENDQRGRSSPRGDQAGENDENDATNWLVSQNDYSQFDSYRISDLNEIARAYNVDVSGCFERSEIVRLLVEAQAHPRFSSGGGGDGLDALGTWSVSQLRALSNEVEIDLSGCHDKEHMVEKIVAEVTCGSKSHVVPYLRTLAPLATMSLSQLRSQARDWSVGISDCIEKEEIINRLIASIKQNAR